MSIHGVNNFLQEVTVPNMSLNNFLQRMTVLNKNYCKGCLSQNRKPDEGIKVVYRKKFLILAAWAWASA